MCSRLCIFITHSDGWLLTSCVANQSQQSEARPDVNVLEFTSSNRTISSRALSALFLCARLWSLALLFCADLCVFYRAISQPDGEEGSSNFLRSPSFFFPGRSAVFFTKKHILRLLWTRLVATFCVVCFVARSFFWGKLRWWNGRMLFVEWWWCYMFTKFSPLTLCDVFIEGKSLVSNIYKSSALFLPLVECCK